MSQNSKSFTVHIGMGTYVPEIIQGLQGLLQFYANLPDDLIYRRGDIRKRVNFDGRR